ncbi:MAG: DUF5666 domain-containing protein [Thermoanaerobaculia bacterium]|jgi:hypothetical protein
MKARLLPIFGLVVILGLVACNGEKSVTGTNGMRQVAGKVVPVGDIEGSSPQGIEVRVRGVGIAAVTDATGSFALTGVPDGALELSFSRSSDGIGATLEVDAGADALIVELQRNSASPRRRGARSPRIQIEGPITAVSDTSITVLDASRKIEVTAAIVATTTIRKGNRKLTPADLAVGNQVHVTASPNPDATYNAIEIKLQEGEDDGGVGDDDPPAKRELEGPVVAISAASITVTDASTGEQTAVINGDTVIRKGGTTLTTADIKVGDRVHVKAKVEADNSLTALEIMVQNNR